MNHAFFKLDTPLVSGDTQHQIMNIKNKNTIRNLGPLESQ